jgi:hypothetical protein
MIDKKKMRRPYVIVAAELLRCENYESRSKVNSFSSCNGEGQGMDMSN